MQQAKQDLQDVAEGDDDMADFHSGVCCSVTMPFPEKKEGFQPFGAPASAAAS